jgi:hypothetical protein
MSKTCKRRKGGGALGRWATTSSSGALCNWATTTLGNGAQRYWHWGTPTLAMGHNDTCNGAQRHWQWGTNEARIIATFGFYYYLLNNTGRRRAFPSKIWRSCPRNPSPPTSCSSPTTATRSTHTYKPTHTHTHTHTPTHTNTTIYK